MVNGETKDNIVAEASAHFKLQGQILVFQDGTEVPDNFNIPSYILEKKIRFPPRAKASEKLYLLHASERQGICSNIYNIVNFFAIFGETYNTLMIRWMTLHSTLSIFVTYGRSRQTKNNSSLFFISGCSEAYNLSRYPQWDALNSQAAEHANSSLKNIKASLSYMNQKKFISHCKYFLWYRNMLRRKQLST